MRARNIVAERVLGLRQENNGTETGRCPDSFQYLAFARVNAPLSSWKRRSTPEICVI